MAKSSNTAVAATLAVRSSGSNNAAGPGPHTASMWRETVYDVRGNGRGYSQIENLGDTGINTYECLAVEDGSCTHGAALVISKCSHGDQASTRWSWIGAKQGQGKLESDSCLRQSMCAGVVKGKAVLVPCSAAAATGWMRH